MFRNLIFDWSGTLVDDLGPVIEATNIVLGKYAIPPMDREMFRRQFRLPYHEFYTEMLPHVPLDELEAHFRPAFDSALTPVTILPHAREKLEWCADNGIRTFVLTAMDPTAFERQMDDFDLRGLFEATYSGVVDKREVIHQILENHSLNPEETAFIGDMTHDVETARHGGVSSIAVLTGYNHPEILASVRPDLTVPDLGVLRSLLDRLLQTQPTHPTLVERSRSTKTAFMNPPDTIEIRRLQVHTRIGVPDDERAEPQTLLATVQMIPSQGFEGLADDISRTIDYDLVAKEIQALAALKTRRLIETLAREIADFLLTQHPLQRVSVTLEKHILPDTDCVAVHLTRER